MNSGVSSFSNDDILFEIRVGNELFGTTACVSFITSVSMTRAGECVDAVIESGGDITYIRFPTEAGVGEIEYSVRIHNGIIKIPTVGVAAFVEGTLVNMPLEEGVFKTRQSLVEQRIAQEREYWTAGAFSLQNTAGEIKGALVFDDEGVRVLVFDRHWLTPDVQYSSLETDGFDWIAEFETEPQFFESSTYIRIHFLERLVTIPQSLKRTENDIQYTMVPNPPSFEELEQLQVKQIEQSVEEEERILSEVVQGLGAKLTTEQKCIEWMNSGALEAPFWIGYSVQAKWVNANCVLYIEPETVQYRRKFIGTLDPKSN